MIHFHLTKKQHGRIKHVYGGLSGSKFSFPVLLCYCAILLFCYDVLSFCFNILSFCYAIPSFSYSSHSLLFLPKVQLCGSVVLLGYFVSIFWIVMLFCHSLLPFYHSIMLFCVAVLPFCFSRPILNARKLRTSYQSMLNGRSGQNGGSCILAIDRVRNNDHCKPHGEWG